MNKFPIAIDATQLFYRSFIIPGVTQDFTSSRVVQTLGFSPGEYGFQVQSGAYADLSFTVTPQGTLDYDPSCDTFLSGRGTSSLQLVGLEVTLDASSLSGASGGGGVLLGSIPLTNEDWIQRRTIRLLPQSGYLVQQGSGIVAELTFGLERSGNFSYAPELDAAQGGPLVGAGTNCLTFKGFPLVVDASAVSRFLTIYQIWGLTPAQDGKATIVVLPADGFMLQLDQGVTDLGFSVGMKGEVTLNHDMAGWLGLVPEPAGGSLTVRVLRHPAPQAPQQQGPAPRRICGVPDTPPQMLGSRPLSYGSPLGRWTRGNLTINVNPTGCQGISTNDAVNLTLNAYALYQTVQPFFSFTQGGQNSDIRVRFGGTDLAPGLGEPEGPTGVGRPPPAGDLYLDAGTMWTAPLLLSLVLHEAGHTLGLSHSTLRSSVMYPFVANANMLDGETVEAIQNLYGWSPQVQLVDRASTDGPSFALVSEPAFGGTGTTILYMAWKGTKGDSGLYFASSQDGNQWSPQRKIDGVGSSNGPTLAIYHPPSHDGFPYVGLAMAWKGTRDDHNIFWAVSPDRQNWSPQQRIDVGTTARPALVEFNHQMILAWKGTEGDSGIYWSRFDGVNSWSPQRQIAGRGTSHGPAMVVFNEQLHMFWKGVDNDHNVYHAILVDPDNGIWGPQEMVVYVDAGNLASGQTPIPIATSDSPVATVRGNDLILAWKGVPGDHALWFSTFGDGSFSGQMSVPDVGSESGPGLASLSGRLVLGWRGIGADRTLYVSTLG